MLQLLRGRRLLRRSLRAVLLFVLLALLCLAVLLLATPSVGGAMQLARAQARHHDAVLPGPAVPPRFAAALTATEDHRFGSEPGIDLFGVARAVAGTLAGREEGAATLYQQLAKLLYTPGQGGLAARFEQAGLAIKLRYSYSGSQVLRMYSGVAYFGHGFYGLGRASCGYFGTPAAAMTWPQAALLAGLVLAPSADDPLLNPAGGRAREAHVLGRLVATGALSQRRAAAALAIPIRRLLARSGPGCRL